MEKQPNKIKCPNCDHEIDVNDILYHQVNEELKKKFNDQLTIEKNRFQEQSAALKDEKAKLEKERAQQAESINEGIKSGLNEQKQRLQNEIKAKLDEEMAGQIKAAQDELKLKSEQLKEFNKAKSDIERLKREKEEIKDAIEAKSEKKLNEKLAEMKDKISSNEKEKSQLKIAEKEKVIEQLNEQLKDAQKKAEQGSSQLQGEVQELAIEDWLRNSFPLDTIVEVKKGARGADCMQTVNTHTRQNCGTIYYESKRTKGFQPGWIEKFKNDIREKGADIGVLVTESMPADMERMGLKDGVWICAFEEFRGLCAVLRDSIIRLSDAITTQENKGDKMGMLYDFLTSNEFKLQVEAIVEGFTQMQTDLESEKRSMTGIWKKREKQIQKVLLNTNHMYSSIKGIAGNAIQSIPLLELPDDEKETTDPENE